MVGSEDTLARPNLYRGAPLSSQPLVSVCMPTFNGARHVDEAINSALAQTYEPLEVIVIDDASDDDTVTRIQSRADERIRLHVNKRRLGHSANRNHTLSVAQGELIKFLDQDDVLRTDCVIKMAEMFSADTAIGLVFSRRWIELEGLSRDHWWVRGHGEVHTGFKALKRLNDGRQLLAELLAAGLPNWIGEPSAVMVRRSHLERSGGFPNRVRQLLDVDLWVRIFSRALVGFIDEPLAGYRYGHASDSATNLRSGRDWLDRLWILEALAHDNELKECYPDIERNLIWWRRRAWRAAVRLGHVRDGYKPLGPYVDYLHFRALATVGRQPPLHQELVFAKRR